jgi:DNA-binding transcriptional ArsR family regulator
MNVEDVCSSRLRMKILKILFNVGELNVSEIARRLKINYVSANNHLKILEDEGILQRKMFGRIQLYRVNEQSPKTKALQNLVDAWEHQNKK